VSGVFARIHTLETTPEEHERGLAIVRDELLPWTEESSGFRGLIGLRSRDQDRTLVVTLWADEAALAASADAADRLSNLAAEFSGATRRSLESYEVSLFDLPQ
jgi:heme-degrading monooxygenase HmoA